MAAGALHEAVVQLTRSRTLSPLQSTVSPKAPRGRRFSGRVAAGIVYAALAGPPLLYGSRDAITLAGWCALLGVGLILVSTRHLRAGHLILLGGIAFITLCFVFVLHEQMAVRPWIAPFNPIWAKASEALGEQLAPSVSIVRGEPFFALGHPLANILALVLGLIVGVDSSRARRGIRVLAWAGAIYAIYGILALVFDPTAILWREKTAYIGNLTATFINRNTAATYFGSCSVVWLVLLMGAIRESAPPGRIEWRALSRRLLYRTRKDLLIRFVMLFICLSAMFMTGSRGGVLISLGVMVVVIMIYFRHDLPRRSGLLLVVASCLAGGLLLLQVFGGSVSQRIDVGGLGDAGRLSAYRSTLKMITDNPLFGTGLGTFAQAFPAYRNSDISMQGVWDAAHSTPLELTSEMGIPLALAVTIAWIVALIVLLGGLRNPRRSISVPLSAFSVSLIALLHSCIDFSLQVAGYSIVVFALLGLGLSRALVSREQASSAQHVAASPR